MNVMRRGYKSKKMLFFIVLLFVIIQVVTIIGLADEANDDITDASNIISLSNDTQSSDFLESLMTPIEEIMSLASNDQALVIEEISAIPDKVLEMTEVPENIGTVTNDTGATAETTLSNTDIIPFSSESTNPPPTDSVDSDNGSSSNEVEKLIEPEEPTNLLPKIGYDSAFIIPKPELTIEIPDCALLPGDKVEVSVTSKGETVTYAKVTFIGTSLTDNYGIAYFEIPKSLEAGKYILFAAKPGYLSAYKWIKISKQPTEYGPPYIQLLSRFNNFLSFQNAWNFSFLDRIAFQTDK